MKCDITISRRQTINVGNYSSINPNVSVTIKDVDSEEFADKYDKLSNLVSCLSTYETKTSLEEIDMVKSIDSKCKYYVSKMAGINFDSEIERLTRDVNN